MISETPLSPGLRQELAVVTATGLYSDPERFLADAVRTFLAARPVNVKTISQVKILDNATGGRVYCDRWNRSGPTPVRKIPGR